MLARAVNVSKSYTHRKYGLVRALRNVSLEVGGGIHLIIGDNGSGKSTLLRVMAGITKPDSGLVEVLGKTLYSECGEECMASMRRRMIGYLPQNLLVPGRLRVLEAVGMPLWLDGDREWKDKVADILGQLGVEKLANKMVHDLSIGQRQLMAIARAFVAQPRLVLLDEPFSHLDEEALKIVENLICTYPRDSAIMITSPRDIELPCEYMVFEMERGRLEASKR